MRHDQARAVPQPEGNALRKEILQLLDDTVGRRNWAHTGVIAAVRGLGVEEAIWKPTAGHSVWQQINHIAHWKRYILQWIQGKHPRVYQAWPAAGRTLAELRRTIADLMTLHRDLRNAVTRLPAGELTRKRRVYNRAQLLLGGAAHDSYHIGQIILTRKLYRQRRRGAGAPRT